jgi:hypothetical protein
LWGNLRERDHLEDKGVNGKIIMKWVLEKWKESHGLNSSFSEEGQMEGCFESGNEPSDFIKCEKFIE